LRDFLIKKILKRKLFKGQFKIFLWLLKNHKLKQIKCICKPIIGNFNINVETKNFIDASIYYTGDYEPYLKKHFKNLIKKGDFILDIGANIGFHTLYFAELTGVNGKVFSFEPIPINFDALQRNIELNQFPQIKPVNKALGNINMQMNVHINQDAQNPGAFNLFENGEKNTIIACIKGDDYLAENKISKINFIKVDVEGFELEVFKGLTKTIQNSKPIIIFEYDKNYQAKLNEDPKAIIQFLANFSYQFFSIDGYGQLKTLHIEDEITSSEILALPTN
jgi:FkbM family methyltransferase